MENNIWGDYSKFESLCSNLNLTDNTKKKLHQCNSFGLVDYNNKAMITFAETNAFAVEAMANPNVAVILLAKESHQFNDERVCLVEDPKYTFWSLFNYHSKLQIPSFQNKIHKTAYIDKTAQIAENGVVIDENAQIGPNVVIHEKVFIGKNTIIDANAVIGSQGFEIKRTMNGLIRVHHDGAVIIGDNVVISALCNITKGLMGKDTIIGENTKIDSLVHIAHCCNIGKNNTIAASASFSGSVTMGDDNFVGTNATIKNGVTIGNNTLLGIGSITTKDVADGGKVLPMRRLRKTD